MTARLVLFDIDGTLLSAGRVFRQALAETLTATFGTAGPMEGYEFSGRTDPEIVRGLMSAAGIDQATIDARMQPTLARFSAALVPLLVAGAIAAKPGIPQLLDRLRSHANVTLGLVTGNLEPCARAKLAPLGLNAYFAFGAFGSDHEDRNELPAIAVQRAHRATGRRFTGKRVVIVGDSVYDVRCGRGIGVRTVAVASGSTSRERLSAEEPDALLDDLSDVDAAVSVILGANA